MTLLTTGNPKIAKGLADGVLTSILHLAPSKLSGYNVCPMASQGCASACLNTAGRGGMVKIGESTNDIQRSRIRKTEYFFQNRSAFMRDLVKDIESALRIADKYNLLPAFRLNGTSDIRWENIAVNNADNLMALFPNVQFYDYTKLPNRRDIPSNYHLTFSRSENNEHYIPSVLASGMNIAVVFRKDGAKVKKVYTLAEQFANKLRREQSLAQRDPNRTKKAYAPRKVDLSWVPKSVYNAPTYNGDTSDLRFRDPKGVIVALLAKGNAKYDTSGFVYDVYTSTKVA